MSAQNKELLQERYVSRRRDILFDREAKLDLGGGDGPSIVAGSTAHTLGDELIPSLRKISVLFPGDIVQKNIFPMMGIDVAGVKGWLAILDTVEALHPRWIVPDHGLAVVDGTQIGKEREYILALQVRIVPWNSSGKDYPAAEGGKANDHGNSTPSTRIGPNVNNIAGEVARVSRTACGDPVGFLSRISIRRRHSRAAFRALGTNGRRTV